MIKKVLCILLLPLSMQACGVALVRLRQPIEHYVERYDDPAWGIKKLLFLLEKQRNRGQDGAGITIVQLGKPSGQEYFHTFRSADTNSLDKIVKQVGTALKGATYEDRDWKAHSPYIGEILLGHVRYATHSGSHLKYCQPFIRSHHIPVSQLALAGNFNMTNTPYLFEQLEKLGLVLSIESDTQVLLDTIAYELDRAYEKNCTVSNTTASTQVDIASVLKNAAKHWDGGYLLCGALGNGDLFVCRDPAGIRPGYYFINEEVIAVASEKVALMETFNLDEEAVLSIKPGYALIVNRSGTFSQEPILPPLPERQCSFERIYFSKANDPEIYRQRKALGHNLTSQVLEALQGEIDHTIFTFVPNSSILAFQGLIEGIYAHKEKMPRIEYLIAKNQKIRTFISSDLIRNSLVTQLYEVTKGIVQLDDTLVVVDDSIVRGITLRDSLIPKLIQLKPKKIILVSSAPPILYPDCYGIDMSQLGRFAAFQAAVSLLQDRGQEALLEEIYNQAMDQREGHAIENCVKRIYNTISTEELSARIAQIISPPFPEVPIQVIYQSLDGLRAAMPLFTGDWYFSGDYPTKGGYDVLNNSFLKWYSQDDSRSY